MGMPADDAAQLPIAQFERILERVGAFASR
jgi:hypothetical protein